MKQPLVVALVAIAMGLTGCIGVEHLRGDEPQFKMIQFLGRLAEGSLWQGETRGSILTPTTQPEASGAATGPSTRVAE